MRTNLNYIMAVTTRVEAGYVNNPRDKGGPTNHGVTQATLSAYRGHKVSIAEVKALTKAEAIEILKVGYYDKVWGDKLPDGIDLSMTDWAVNSGPSRPVKEVQKLVGVAQDGIMGPLTLRAIEAKDAYTLNKQINDARMAYFKSLSDFKYFGRGWTIRVTGKDPKHQWKDAPGIASMSSDLIRKRKLVLVNPPDVVLEAGKATDASKKFTAGKTGKALTVASVGAVFAGIAEYGPSVLDFVMNAQTYADQLNTISWISPKIGAVVQVLSVIGTVGALFANRAKDRASGYDFSQ